MENHYNLLYREDERELIPICRQTDVSLMPYSPLAAGHLARATWNADTLRGKTDRVARGKYDRMEAQGIAYLEELYMSHPVVGAIDHNPEPGGVLLDEKK